MMRRVCIVLKQCILLDSCEFEFEKLARQHVECVVLFSPLNPRYDVSGTATHDKNGISAERITVVDRVGDRVMTTTFYAFKGTLALVVKHNGFKPTWFGEMKLGEKHRSATMFKRTRLNDSSDERIKARLNQQYEKFLSFKQS
jgi:hypothetical protein